MPSPRFDKLSGSYEDLLRDPIRDRFSATGSQFFHLRKRDLIRQFFRGRTDTRTLRYLDVGCGKGELLNLLRGDFHAVAGCDVSGEMMQGIEAIETRRQEEPLKVPFSDGSFDFVTAVCVYHHVAPADRPALTKEISRVLKPGGIFCMVEHNPLNPVTRLIVSRTPVDEDAILLHSAEARRLTQGAGMTAIGQEYFLYLPETLYRFAGGLERLLRKIPFGGQYALFASAP